MTIRPRASSSHAGFLEPKAIGIGRAAGGHEHGVRVQDRAGGELDGQPAAVPLDADHTGAKDQLDSAPLELVSHEPRQLTSTVGSRTSDWLTSVDGMPSAVNTVANSTPIDPPPTTTMSFGTLRKGVDLIGVVDIGIVEGNARGVSRAGPRRNQDRARRKLALRSRRAR